MDSDAMSDTSSNDIAETTDYPAEISEAEAGIEIIDDPAEDSNPTENEDTLTHEIDAAGEIPIETEATYEIDTELQIQEAAEVLEQMPALEPSNWGALDANQRLEALQDIENHMAEIQGRPPTEVAVEPMEESTFGGYDGTRMVINSDHLNSDMPVTEFIDTVIHEGRHAYQDYAVDNPGFSPNQEQVATWAENMAPGNYLNPNQYGQELYQGQPIEADAFDYATRITSLFTGNEDK